MSVSSGTPCNTLFVCIESCFLTSDSQYTPYLKSVKLAVEVDGEQQDVEDYSDHIKDAELGDHGPEWDF